MVSSLVIKPRFLNQDWQDLLHADRLKYSLYGKVFHFTSATNDEMQYGQIKGGT